MTKISASELEKMICYAMELVILEALDEFSKQARRTENNDDNGGEFITAEIGNYHVDVTDI